MADSPEFLDQELGEEVLDYDDQAQADQDQETEIHQQQNEGAGNLAGSGGQGQDPMSLPPHGTEVFISKIPREATDAQLLSFCEQLNNKVHSIRLAKDPGNPGQNKGYAFAVYSQTVGANETLQKLNQAELPDFPGRKVTIVRSELNNKLFIGNIPREMTKEEIVEALKAVVVGLLDMRLMMEKNPNTNNRGFGFVEFFNKAAAEAARKHLSSPDFKLRGQKLDVKWAEAKKNDVNLEQVKSIYVGNLPDKDVDEGKVRNVFSGYGKISQVVLLKDPSDHSKMRNYCFVHFEERSSAIRAVEEATEGTKPELDGKELMVHMARPQPRDEEAQGNRSAGTGARGNHGGVGGGRGSFRTGSGAGGAAEGGYGGGGGGRGGGHMSRAPTGPPSYPSGREGAGGRGQGAGGRGAMAPGGRGGGYGARAAPAVVAHYDDGGYDEGYGAEEDYAVDDYDGYGGGYGGYSTAGMTMMPMMMPGGQIAYVMAAPGGGVGAPAMSYRQQPPPPSEPPPPSGGPVRRSTASPREYVGGGGEHRGSGGYGSAPSRAAPSGGSYGASGGGYGARGSAYGVRAAGGEAPVSRGGGYGEGRSNSYGYEDGYAEREVYLEPRRGGRGMIPAERPGPGSGRGRAVRYVPY